MALYLVSLYVDERDKFSSSNLDKRKPAYLRFDQLERQLHVLDVRAVNAQLDNDWVKHMEHHGTCSLGALLAGFKFQNKNGNLI